VTYALPIVREDLPHNRPESIAVTFDVDHAPDERATYIEGLRRCTWRHLDREWTPIIGGRKRMIEPTD
jgi:hypothetical protein